MNPSASLTVKSGVKPGAYAGGSPKFQWHFDVFPVLVSLSGTYDPAHGDFRALTGQQITATLAEPNGLPLGTKVTSYTWSFTGGTHGNPIKNWTGTNNLVQLIPLTTADLSGTDTTGNGISVSPVSFYDQYADQTVIVNCIVNLTFPDGKTQSVTVMSAPVTFVKPTVTWVVNKSYNNFTPGFLSTLSRGPAFGANELWGPMTITEPAAFVKNGPGTGCIVQVANPLTRSFSGKDQNGKVVTYSKIQVLNGNGVTGSSSSPTGLDAGFPYPFGQIANSDGTFTAVNSSFTWKANIKGYSVDGPAQPFTPANSGTTITWFSSTANDSFNTWVMYCPPANGSGTIYVPLQTLTWSWGGNASLSGSVWSVAEGPPFTLGAPGKADTPPSWNLEILPGLIVGP